jgi:dihydroflavonol-4-reductase
MIVVTGGTGHVGNALLRALMEHTAEVSGEPGAASRSVRALIRPGRDTSCLAGLDVEVVRGDVRDLDSLIAAFHGADAVFHLAGKISITRERLERLRETNVEGTKNVIAACRAAGVRRLVYTSSIHAFVETPHGTCIDENTPVEASGVNGSYGKSKAEATNLVFKAAREGLDAVVVFPTGIVGPFDYRPSETGQVIVDFCRGKIPAWTDGAYNFVDVRDVAAGLIAALERGRSGEGYVLSGSVISVWDLLHLLEEFSGKPAPRLHVGIGFMRAIAPIIPVYYWITRQRPLFTKYSLDVLCSNCEISNAKAERERDTLADSLRWFEEQGML